MVHYGDEMNGKIDMSEPPDYTVIWNGATVEVTIGTSAIEEPYTPGTTHLLDSAGFLVGGRIDNINNAYWTEGKISRFFGMCFGRGGAEPIHAMRRTCPDDTMRDKYRQYWKSEPPW